MKRYASRLNLIRLNNQALFAWTKIAAVPQEKLKILLNRQPVKATTGKLETADGLYAYVFIAGDYSDAGTHTLEVKEGNETISMVRFDDELEDQTGHFSELFGKLTLQSQDGLFERLMHRYADEAKLAQSETYRMLIRNLHAQLVGTRFESKRSFWLSSHVLYFEGQIDQRRPMGDAGLMMVTTTGVEPIQSRYVQMSERDYAFIAVLPEAFNEADGAPCLTYFSDDRPVAVHQLHPQLDSGLEFVQYLNQKPPHQKQPLREIVCSTLIDFSARDQRKAAGDLIKKLQLFVQLPPVYCMEKNDPFNIHFETVIPIDSEGVFASGWIRDPYKMLESITVKSALGLSFPMHQNFFRVNRPDVQQHFQETPYGKFDEHMGFVAYAPLPEEMRRQIDGIAQLHSLRFVVTLNGGITYEIQPDQTFRDAFDARDVVTKMVPSSNTPEEMLKNCLGPVAASLQKRCMDEVGVKEVYEFGIKISQPKVSLSIPLYKRLDFLKVQLANMANDPDMKECELIYVLDSPWQEAEVRDFLREYAYLYQLCVKLVVMKRNSGYAAASNTGTIHARGDYIVLLNSDVFPRGKGWVSGMTDLLKNNPKIGAVAPKLLYEDDSLQHAGMFFAKTTHPDWINLHYYKGYPGGYGAATQNRPVPAVTGACLMMRKDVWEEVGRLSTDYIIGDFEDSDLCLKCAERGYETWYYADAELYHLERQSVPLNDSYTDSMAWRYNAHLHSSRWNGMIEKLMHQYGAM